jgi:hypothetical protein
MLTILISASISSVAIAESTVDAYAYNKQQMDIYKTVQEDKQSKNKSRGSNGKTSYKKHTSIGQKYKKQKPKDTEDGMRKSINDNKPLLLLETSTTSGRFNKQKQNATIDELTKIYTLKNHTKKAIDRLKYSHNSLLNRIKYFEIKYNSHTRDLPTLAAQKSVNVFWKEYVKLSFAIEELFDTADPQEYAKKIRKTLNGSLNALKSTQRTVKDYERAVGRISK